MEWLSSNNILMMEQSMRFLWSKQNAILDNIANVETPGYKSKYVTFEETLRNKLVSTSKDGGSAAQYRNVLNTTTSRVHRTTDESMRMDENNVNATEQSVELARNAYQIQYVMQSISSDLSILGSAIKGQ